MEAEAGEVDRPEHVGHVGRDERPRGRAVRRRDLVVCSQSGALSGTRFWKNELPARPLGEALHEHRAAAHRPHERLGDAQVVGGEIELGLAALSEEDLVRVTDQAVHGPTIRPAPAMIVQRRGLGPPRNAAARSDHVTRPTRPVTAIEPLWAADRVRLGPARNRRTRKTGGPTSHDGAARYSRASRGGYCRARRSAADRRRTLGRVYLPTSGRRVRCVAGLVRLETSAGSARPGRSGRASSSWPVPRCWGSCSSCS